MSTFTLFGAGRRIVRQADIHPQPVAIPRVRPTVSYSSGWPWRR